MGLIPKCDFETRSRAELRKVGAFRYSLDPSTTALCLAYDLKDGKGRRLWHRWFPDRPADLLSYVEAGGVIESHNAEFEYCIWNHVMVPQYGWPKISIEQLRDSAANAAALGLPRGLGDLGDALDVDVKKDKAGHRLMLKMSKPRKHTKTDTSDWHESIDDLDRLFEYCDTDIVSEEACSTVMPPLIPAEQKTWELNLKINERGIYCDTELCKVAVNFAKQFEHELTAELHTLTDSRVRTAKQVAKLREELLTEGLDTPNLQAKMVADILDRGGDRLTPRARRILEVRQLLGKSSISKYQAMLNMACPDSRIRGTLLYHGAHTGRWAGRGIQPQNFAQGKIKDVHNIFAALEARDYEWFKCLFPDVFTALSAGLRGMLRAAPGLDLMAGDFNAIEARVICWLAGDEDNLNVYHRGGDPYKEMASAIFNVPLAAVTKAQRELGKRVVLACGFGMGWKKFMATCEQFNQPVTEALAQHAVNTYRNKYEAVKAYWYDLSDAAIRAVRSPGHRIEFRNLQFLVKGRFLFCQLPSGRRLAYCDPRVDMVETEWGLRPQLSYMGTNSTTKKWEREHTYGGKLAENVTQAAARDVMRDAMFRLERANYPMILTVHDEIVTEIPKGFGSETEFQQLMSLVPKWAEGLPVKVETWRDERYKK